MVEAVGGPDCPGLLVYPLKTSITIKEFAMKISALFGVAVALLSTVALAHDLTYMGPIKANETKTVKVELPAGKLTIEVYSSSPSTKFNCQFQSGYGSVVFEQANTYRCVGRVLIQSDSTLNVSVKNLGADSDYKIWVHDS